MCTVTVIPFNNKLFITSNRDERSLRKDAIEPVTYLHGDSKLTYPKDADAGGSWIAVNHIGNAAVLLNGAFEKHISKPPYRKSRGLIFIDIIKNISPVNAFAKIDLDNIECFTIIIFENNDLFECRWDGKKKYCRKLENNKPHIWSSATLYPEHIVKKREKWFSEWLHQNQFIAWDDIIAFHKFGGDGDVKNDFKMNRDGLMYTVSITSIAIDNNKALMHYADLKNNKISAATVKFTSSLQFA